jgi:predicted DsbA family dithiol-disulfide isomerase
VRTERLEREYDLKIGWIAFPLHPDTPEEGLEIERLFKDASVDVQELMDRLRRAAEQEGLPFGERKKTYNSRLAQELSKWAESKGKGKAFRNAVFRAYFLEGLNIAKIHNLVDLAAHLDLPGQEAREVLETGRYREAVDRDWSRSYALGVRAVPTFRLNEGILVGAQPYGNLKQFMEANNVRRRSKPLRETG